MDALSEEFRRSEQADMTMLTCEEMTELEEPAVSDEVEDLRNSLREAVHDEGVRPKMQCLMMDGSFSMVTVQGEDSAIQWETSVSRSATPWAAEPQGDKAELQIWTKHYKAPMMRASTPSSGQAGRIIFVMDEEQISSRRRARERVSSPKKEVFLPEDVDPVSGRKELVEVSQPNVKLEGDGEQDEAVDVMEHKRLFRLVSEGSEILNMMVPSETNLASVDEEESTVMVDNLSYLEETPATKTNEEYDDNVFEPFNEPPPPPPGKAVRSSRGSVSLSRGGVMDPPGAPVSRPPPPGRKAAGNVDYFEKFTLIDGQAPGSPALVPQGAEDLRRLEETKSPGSEETDLLRHSSASQRTTAVEEAAPELLPGDDELASDHMDDVFYGATDAVQSPKDREDKKRPPRLSLKSSGSALFGSQEDLVLTPIFLPEGPAKIIDQILLEEPKAMAFMYTDLYEEAMGCRGKEEDTESLSSEKSFHSRHSDREARGYLEMYVLKDETPAAPPEEDVEHAPPPETEAATAATRGNNGKEPIVRMLSQDSYDFGESEISDALLNAEEEVTDFLRASDNSSPCDIDPFPQSQRDENDAASSAKSKPRRRRKAAQTTETTPQIPSDQPAENETAAGQTTDFGEFYLGIDKTPAADTFAAPKAPGPVAPPRKKADSAPKATLDLTPLMAVEVAEEGEVAGGKEQREEEKETASPVETADEGDEGEQKPSTEAPEAAADSDAQTAERKDSETTARETSDTETAEGLTGQEVAVIKAVDSVHTRVEEAERPKETEAAELSAGEQSECPVAAVTEPAKQPGRCVIL